MPFKNRIRLPFYLSKAQFPMERSVFRRADGTTKVLSVVVRNTYEGITDYLPESWHRKLVIALSHDSVTIEGDRYLGDVVLDGDYAIEWQDFLDYPVAQAGFTVQVTPFDATNSNCVSCSQVTQLSVADDEVPGLLGDGDAGEVNVYENDAICCYPATSELTYTNTDFIENAVLDESGNFTFTAVTPVSQQNGVKIATYRVTCPDGSYDDGDIFADFDGTGGSSCCQPYALIYDAGAGTISWAADCDPDNGFNYDFRNAEDPGVPVASGNVAGNTRFVNIPPEVTGTAGEYIFTIYSDCGTSQSETTTLNFTVGEPAGECYTFQAFRGYPETVFPVGRVTYMNCSGGISNILVPVLEPVTFCALVYPGTSNPVYLEQNRPDIEITPVEPC